jgi:PAS domain S-box-containing protein
MEKSREELETSRVRLEEVMNAAELGFWTWDIQANRVVGDRHFAFLFGVAEEEATKGMSAETCMQRVHPDDQSAIRESLARMFSRGGPYAIEFRTCSADSKVRWIGARGSVKLDSENRAQSLNGVVHDVTARKEAEERLKESEEHFRHTVEFNPQVPWTADAEGNILDFNHNWLELTGLTREAALGNGWMDVPHPDDRARVIVAWMHSVETGEPYDVEQRIRLADGTYRWMRSRAFARRNAEGKIVLWYGTTEDIAERKDAEDERERLMKELERSNGELAEFSHVVSHDLQTPIRMVKSFSELLARRYKGKLDETADEVIGSIQGGAASMEQLVLKLLHYAMVGQEPMTRGPVELGRVVDAALTLLRLAIEETGAQVKHGELPTIEGDPVLLQQLFQNLINNALKYQRPSMPPRIEVHATEHEKEWLISVADNGMGIEPTYHDRIFAPLKRLHGNEIPGTGIGLAICRKIVERHEGRIWVESQVDKGSTFYFTLPQH